MTEHPGRGWRSTSGDADRRSSCSRSRLRAWQVQRIATAFEQPIVVKGCDRLYYERPGTPQVLIVSDLPLEDSAHTAMQQMTQAIKLTLKDDGFRAGRFSVGYVVCDDSGSAGRWSAKRCVANARAAVRNRKVVAVIGTLDSGCARAELPVLGAAKLLLVSPLNTATDLTHTYRGKIARLSAPDSAQAAAAARFLRNRGVDDGRGALRRHEARRRVSQRSSSSAARRLGLRIVARGHADAAYAAAFSRDGTRAEVEAARRRVRRTARSSSQPATGRPPSLRTSSARRPRARTSSSLVSRSSGSTRPGATSSRISRPRSARHRIRTPSTRRRRRASLLDSIARSSGTRASVGRGSARRRRCRTG